MTERDKARCHTAYKGRILTRNFCRLSITFDCRGRACLPFPFPSLDLFEDRHDHRHGNRREQRRVNGILVLIGLSRPSRSAEYLGLSHLRLTKYSSPTIFGLKNARSANALARFVRSHTLLNLRPSPVNASSNNRTAVSTSPTTSLPTRISWIRATRREMEVSVASASAAVVRICVRRRAAICHALGMALSAGLRRREGGIWGTPRSSVRSCAKIRNAARMWGIARDSLPDG